MTDFVMPRMSGRELSEILAQSFPHLRVLFMSGYTDVALFQELPPHAAFLQKPFSPRALASKVREVLNANAP